MSGQLAAVAGLGVYLLLGFIVFTIRWNYGVLRMMAESIASQYNVPPEKVKLVGLLFVVLWPFFVKGILDDQGRIRRVAKAWNDKAVKCECGGQLSVAAGDVRNSISTGLITAKCGSCGRTETAKMDITIKWTDE